MKKSSSRRFTWLILLGLLVLPGCLEADRVSIVIYDAERDVFRHLRLYFHIASGASSTKDRSEEYEYLEALWKNRQHLIPLPEVWYAGRTGGIIDSEQGFLHVSNHTFKFLTLNEEDPETETLPTSLALDDIVIKPGHFFQSPQGTLCYYHQTEFSGQFLDRLLLVTNDTVCESLLNAIPKERQRRQAGGAIMDWEKERAKLQQSLQGNETPSSTDTESDNEPDSPLALLDDKSLRWLLSKAASRELKITRNKDQLKLQFRLSPHDAKQLVLTTEILKQELDKPQTEKTLKGIDVQQLISRYSALTIEYNPLAGDSNVLIRVDLSRFFSNSSKRLKQLEQLAETRGRDKTIRGVVKKVTARGISVTRKETDIKRLVNAFRQGTLK